MAATPSPTRVELVENPKLRFNDSTQKSDLLDDTKTNTFLVAALIDLLSRQPHPIELTAVRSDHPTYDGGPTGNGHNAGKAADLWHADWASVGDDKIADVIAALIKNPYVRTIGLGGYARQFYDHTQWPNDGNGPFVVFIDNSSDHIHIQIENTYGIGPRF